MQKLLTALIILTITISSCRKKDTVTPAKDAPVITVEGNFSVDNLKWLIVKPTVTGDSASTTFTWTLGTDTISHTRDLAYLFKTAGTYTLTLTAANDNASASKAIVVKVTGKTYVNGVNKVFEYFPAPGQFINTMPEYTAGDSDSTMAAKALADITNPDVALICLGGFGGYVTMGFDHAITDSFQIDGNAFTDWSEAGIISVSADVNGNGLPDDEWYEIAGSDYNSAGTIHDYKITYYKPDPNKEQTPDDQFIFSDTTYIVWKDNQGKSGYLSQNYFHMQAYYPEWKGDSISFTGTRLTSQNVYDKSGENNYWVSLPFAWGYADNWPNTDARSVIQVKWAVNSKGQPAQLQGIDFVKVHTGIRAEAYWLGEVSTEVGNIKDLSLAK